MDKENLPIAFAKNSSHSTYVEVATSLISQFEIIDHADTIKKSLQKYDVVALQHLLTCAPLLWQCGQDYNLFYSTNARDNDAAFKTLSWLIEQAKNPKSLEVLGLLFKKLQTKQEGIHALWTCETFRKLIFENTTHEVDFFLQYYIESDKSFHKASGQQSEIFKSSYKSLDICDQLKPETIQILNTIDYFTYAHFGQLISTISAQKHSCFDNKHNLITWCIEQTKDATKFFKLSSIIQASILSNSNNHRMHTIDILLIYERKLNPEKFDAYLEILLEIRLFNEVANISNSEETCDIPFFQIELFGQLASTKHNLLLLKELIVEGKRLFHILQKHADNSGELYKRDSLMKYIKVLLACDAGSAEKSMLAMLNILKYLQCTNHLEITNSIQVIDRVLQKACYADMPTLILQSEILKTLTENECNNIYYLACCFYTRNNLNRIDYPDPIKMLNTHQQFSLSAEHWLSQNASASEYNFNQFKNSLFNFLGFQQINSPLIDRIALYLKNPASTEDNVLLSYQVKQIVEGILNITEPLEQFSNSLDANKSSFQY